MSAREIVETTAESVERGWHVVVGWRDGEPEWLIVENTLPFTDGTSTDRVTLVGDTYDGVPFEWSPSALREVLARRPLQPKSPEANSGERPQDHPAGSAPQTPATGSQPSLNALLSEVSSV